jgi:hypothetical protein
VDRVDRVYVVTGWALGAWIVVLLVLEAFLSIKKSVKPMDREEDRRIRVVKWALTVLMFVALPLHYLLSEWVV